MAFRWMVIGLAGLFSGGWAVMSPEMAVASDSLSTQPHELAAKFGLAEAWQLSGQFNRYVVETIAHGDTAFPIAIDETSGWLVGRSALDPEMKGTAWERSTVVIRPGNHTGAVFMFFEPSLTQQREEQAEASLTPLSNTAIDFYSFNTDKQAANALQRLELRFLSGHSRQAVAMPLTHPVVETFGFQLGTIQQHAILHYAWPTEHIAAATRPIFRIEHPQTEPKRIPFSRYGTSSSKVTRH